MLGLVALFLFFSFSFFFSLVRWTYRCARAEGRDKGQSTSTSYETIKRKSKETPSSKLITSLPLWQWQFSFAWCLLSRLFLNIAIWTGTFLYMTCFIYYHDPLVGMAWWTWSALHLVPDELVDSCCSMCGLDSLLYVVHVVMSVLEEVWWKTMSHW